MEEDKKINETEAIEEKKQDIVANEEKSDKEIIPRDTEEKDGVLTLKKPYKFEGKEYTEIDLTGVAKLTIGDAIDAQEQLAPVEQVVATTSTEFIRLLAQKATDYPVEFFKLLPRGAALNMRSTVLSVIAEDVECEDHVMKFNKPYTYEGKEYTEIDLNGLFNLTCMDESDAESKLARAHYGILQPEKIYLYACIIASKATGQPEEFFKQLPICELIKLVNEIGHEDFLE